MSSSLSRNVVAFAYLEFIEGVIQKYPIINYKLLLPSLIPGFVARFDVPSTVNKIAKSCPDTVNLLTFILRLRTPEIIDGLTDTFDEVYAKVNGTRHEKLNFQR